MTITSQAGNRLRSLAPALSALLLLLAGCTAAKPPATVPLITEEEAALPSPAPETERGACGPPEIRIESPRDGDTYRPPVPIDVRFTPSSGSAIDLASVKVELLKFGMKIDLTKRALKYITPGGIAMPKADVPRGNHHVQITVADTSGKKCSETVEFTVEH